MERIDSLTLVSQYFSMTKQTYFKLRIRMKAITVKYDELKCLT
jgi:hypothetical protein